MRFKVKETRKGKTRGPKPSDQPLSSPTKSPTGSPPSDWHPAGGKGAGGAPSAKCRSKDYAASEEMEMQPTVEISASQSKSRGGGPEDGQIRAAAQFSSSDKAREKGEVSAEMQSRLYREYKVINFEEKVVDGFYDAYGISADSRLQEEIPSLTDLETSFGSSDFEAIIVNRRMDCNLENLVQNAHDIGLDRPATEVTVVVQRLAELVIERMGGPVKDANIMGARWMERSKELRTSFLTSVFPIGCITVGLSRHRALLFKVLADSINLPCQLERGDQYPGMVHDVVNLIKLDDEREYLVDLMAAPGTLILAESLKDHKPYSGEISKMPSSQSPTDLEVVQSRPQPSAGKGSSQSSVMEADSYVDRKSSSKTAELFPPIPVNSNDPGVGSSGVSGGTAQQLNISGVPKSKNSSKDLANHFADLNPFAAKVFGKASMEGNSPGIKISDIKESSQWNPFSENSPMLECSTGQFNMIPCEERLNAQVREDPPRILENLQHGVADSPSRCGSHEISFPDLRKCTNDRFMGTNFVLKDSEGSSSSIDSNANKVDDVDVVDEIQWEDLVIGDRIGIGSYGEVFHARWNDKEVAVKKFLDQEFSGAEMKDFLREVRIMRGLDHPNIVRFKGAVTHPPHLSIITEFLPRGSLYKIIHRPQCKIDEQRRIKMAIDVACGMNCLHTSVPTIVHRDLKSLNLLVDEDWNVKVCDFGLSRVKPNTFVSSKSTGTAAWMAPEVLRDEPSNEKCDVFSFGVILWELATLTEPWTKLNPVQVISKVAVQNERLKIPKEVDPLVGNIIRDCWETEPKLRPSFADLIESLKSVQRLEIPSLG